MDLKVIQPAPSTTAGNDVTSLLVNKTRLVDVDQCDNLYRNTHAKLDDMEDKSYDVFDERRNGYINNYDIPKSQSVTSEKPEEHRVTDSKYNVIFKKDVTDHRTYNIQFASNKPSINKAYSKTPCLTSLNCFKL